MAVRIAIDAMGGDFGPEPIVKGCIEALKARKFNAILVGRSREILPLIPNGFKDKISVVEAEDIIDMSDAATDALKRKDSSIYKAVELVRNSDADAVVSAGERRHVGIDVGYVAAEIFHAAVVFCDVPDKRSRQSLSFFRRRHRHSERTR